MFPLINFTAARTCYCSEQKMLTRPEDCALLPVVFSKEHSNCAATIQCARQHFSDCVVAHPRSLEGTLGVNFFPDRIEEMN
jgi:hypothetical protein